MSTSPQAMIDTHGGRSLRGRLAALRTQFAERFLFGDMPRPARRFGLFTILAGSLAVVFVSLNYPLFSFSERWIASFALLVGAFAIEIRFWSLRGYGIATNILASQVGLLGLLINGPGFIVAYGLVVLVHRWIIRPWATPYRLIWNFCMGTASTLAPALLLVHMFPDGIVSGPSLEFYLVMAAALMLQSVASVPLSTIMISLAEGERVEWSTIGHDILETLSLDAVGGGAILLLAVAWTGGGTLGLVFIIMAVMFPAIVIVTPAIEDAWREVNRAAAAQHREQERQRALSGEIVDEARVAYLDVLTGLGNRLAFEEHLARRGPRGLIVLADAVGLRKLNDLIGHDAGDDLLRAAANGLRASIRGNDRAYRLGGDEFAMILDDLPLTAVEAFLARVSSRIAVEGRATPSIENQRVRLRYGWAAATDPDPYASADAMLTANHALEGGDTARSRNQKVMTT